MQSRPHIFCEESLGKIKFRAFPKRVGLRILSLESVDNTLEQVRGDGGGGGARLSEISYTYDPPIYEITSGCRVTALFWREAPKWTPDAIWFLRYFNPQANGIMYHECREC